MVNLPTVDVTHSSVVPNSAIQNPTPLLTLAASTTTRSWLKAAQAWRRGEHRRLPIAGGSVAEERRESVGRGVVGGEEAGKGRRDAIVTKGLNSQISSLSTHSIVPRRDPIVVRSLPRFCNHRHRTRRGVPLDRRRRRRSQVPAKWGRE